MQQIAEFVTYVHMYIHQSEAMITKMVSSQMEIAVEDLDLAF